MTSRGSGSSRSSACGGVVTESLAVTVVLVGCGKPGTCLLRTSGLNEVVVTAKSDLCGWKKWS